MRRALIIVAILVLVIAIGIAAYFLFFAKPTATLTPTTPSFPDSGAAATQTTAGTEANISDAGKEVAPHLFKITDGPVALGEVAFTHVVPAAAASTSASGTPATAPLADVEVRYIDRASGNIYSYLARARALTRISNRTLPGIQEASWLSDGSMAYARYISRDPDQSEHIETYALSATSGSGFFLEKDLAQATVSGTSTVFTLLSGTTGSIGSVARADGSNPKTLFSSPLSAISVFLSNGPFIAATKASSGLDGYAFALGSNGALTRLLGPFRGLSVLPSPSGKKLLYSYTDQGRMHMNVYDMDAHTATTLPLATLTEKCAWTADSAALYCGVPKNATGDLPDDWYQGAIAFSDRIWRIDLSSRVATLTVDPTQVGKVDIDATGITLDPHQDFLIFRNKTDGSLWAYDL